MHKYGPRVAKGDVTLKTPDEGLHGDGDEDETINVTAHLSFRASAIDPISTYPDNRIIISTSSLRETSCYS